MNKIISMSLVLVFLLTMIQILVSNSLSTTGLTLGKIEDQIITYQRQNELLKEDLLTKSSLLVLNQEAKKLGYVSSQPEIGIAKTLPIALKP